MNACFIVLASARRGAAVEDEPFGVEDAVGDAMFRHRALHDHFGFAGLGVAAENPVALVVVFVGGHGRRAAMRREVEAAIVAHVEPAVNLAGRVVARRQIQDLRRIDKQAERLLLRVVFENAAGARAMFAGPLGADGEVIANTRVVLAVHRHAVAPVGPGLTCIVLAGVVEKIDRWRCLGDDHFFQDAVGSLEEIIRFDGGEFLAVGKRGRERQRRPALLRGLPQRNLRRRKSGEQERRGDRQRSNTAKASHGFSQRAEDPGISYITCADKRHGLATRKTTV